MKASVQYNDFIGTAAADISDFKSLDDLMKSQRIDPSRYEAVGVNFYSGEHDYFSCSLLCLDKSVGDKDNPHLVKIMIDLESKDFFKYFKRFNVVLMDKYDSRLKNIELKEELRLSDVERI